MISKSLKMFKIDRNRSLLGQIVKEICNFNISAFVGFIMWIVTQGYLNCLDKTQEWVLHTKMGGGGIFITIYVRKHFKRHSPQIRLTADL